MSYNQESLKEAILEALRQGSISKLYALEQEAKRLLEPPQLSGYYRDILDLALERLTDALESRGRLSLNNKEDLATLQALYEYALEHYHAGSLSDASALFEVLSGISDDAGFGKAMRLHHAATKSGIELDAFLEHYVDMERVEQRGSFYIADFTQAAHSLLDGAKKE